MQISKKDLSQKKGKIGERYHLEGRHRCDCLVRNFRRKLGLKWGLHLDPRQILSEEEK